MWSDLLELIFEGNMKYVVWFLLFLMVLGLIRMIYDTWHKHETKTDQAYISKHQGETVASFKKRARNLWMTIILLGLVAFPATLFIAIKTLGSIPDLEPWIGVTSVFGIFILFLITLIILAVWTKRLGRRIKRLEQTQATDQTSEPVP